MVVNGWCGIEALPIYVPGFRFLVCGRGGWGLGQGGGGGGGGGRGGGGGGGGGSDDWGAQGVRHFVNCIKR